jgi:hypothetical protein
VVLNLPSTQSEQDTVPFSEVYFPWGHWRHVCSDEAPTVVLYRPAVQLVHDAVLGTLEYLPAAQRTQTDSEVAPGMALYFPTGQLTHVCFDEAPSVVLYRPAGQLVQAEDPFSGAYLPASQSLQLNTDAPGSMYPCFPTAQPLHTLLPGGLNLPTSQIVHAALVLVFSAGAYLPSGQSLLQEDTLTPPRDSENFPPGHQLHSAEPEEGWYLLASHAWHFLVKETALYLPGLQSEQLGNDPPSPRGQG